MQETSVSEPARAWHSIPVADALTALRSASSGLTEEEAQQRLQQSGPNRLPESARRSALTRFLLQFHNLLIYLLLASASVTLYFGHLADTAVILAVVVANAVIGFVQEGKAERALESIRGMLAPHAAVLRAGERASIPSERLVPGDIVLLDAGDKIPADLRVLQAHGLRIEEAILTGESLPAEKQTLPVSGQAALGDRTCLAFSGTLVAAGQGRGVVVATGSATEIGRINKMLTSVETLTTPLVAQMDAFARWLSILIVVAAGLLLAFGYYVAHYPFDEMFMVVVGLSVAAIPEGLPAVLTITLAIGVHAMARRNAIVRSLPAIETLGSVSVICTDKTGTLTRNEMAVAAVAMYDQMMQVSGAGYAPEGRIDAAGRTVTADSHSLLGEIALAAMLCNDAALRERDGEWSIEGDPMEGALLTFGVKAGLDLAQKRRQWSRTDTIPFDAKHRFMATLHHDHTGAAFLFVKGAPERILAMCSAQRTPRGDEPLHPASWEQAASAMAASGQRVLALAARAVPAEKTVLEYLDVEESLVLLGLVGLSDPPRAEAVAAVAECQGAGIRVKMITGDHAGTAAAIARQIGLSNSDSVLTGVDLDAMNDAVLAAVVLETNVFARTSPEHKLRLVKALQAHGMTVAMTGDGVNDAPALRRADAGIAMGKKGSEAAREAAEVVLADDNFSTIVAAVRAGRTVYDNIRKVISWTLPTNAGEAMTIVTALFLGITLPVTPIQILWINLVTAITLGVALAFEPTEANTMRRPPRGRNEPLLTGTLVWHIALVAFLFVCGVFSIYHYALDRGYPLELARTMAVNTLVVMEIFHLFFIRNIYGTSLTWDAVRGTPVVWLTVIAVTAAQFAVTYLPPLQAVFGTASVPFLDGVLIFAVGVALFALVEIEKQLRLLIQGRIAGDGIAHGH